MMLARLRSIADAILGRVPGKPDRTDTATRMAIDADFSNRGEPKTQKRDQPAYDVETLEELQRLTSTEALAPMSSRNTVISMSSEKREMRL